MTLTLGTKGLFEIISLLLSPQSLDINRKNPSVFVSFINFLSKCLERCLCRDAQCLFNLA